MKNLYTDRLHQSRKHYVIRPASFEKYVHIFSTASNVGMLEPDES